MDTGRDRHTVYRRWILEGMDILYTGDGYWKGWTYCIQEMDTGRDGHTVYRRWILEVMDILYTGDGYWKG